MTVEEKILDRAHELFVKQGIKSVTMDELAQSLGMSKRTIYEYYGDKKTLVEEDAKRFHLQMKGETDRLITESDNIIQGVTQVLRFIKAMLQAVIPLYFADMKRYYPSAFEHITQKREMRKVDVTRVLVQRGVDEGVFRKDLNIELVAFFMNGIVLADHETMCEISLMRYGDYEKDVLFAYLSGIATDDGRALIEKEQAEYFTQMNRFGTDIPKFKY